MELNLVVGPRDGVQGWLYEPKKLEPMTQWVLKNEKRGTKFGRLLEVACNPSESVVTWHGQLLYFCRRHRFVINDSAFIMCDR